MHYLSDEGDRLHRLAKAHVVGEHAVDSGAVQRVEEPHSCQLVLAQRAAPRPQQLFRSERLHSASGAGPAPPLNRQLRLRERGGTRRRAVLHACTAAQHACTDMLGRAPQSQPRAQASLSSVTLPVLHGLMSAGAAEESACEDATRALASAAAARRRDGASAHRPQGSNGACLGEAGVTLGQAARAASGAAQRPWQTHMRESPPLSALSDRAGVRAGPSLLPPSMQRRRCRTQCGRGAARRDLQPRP